MCEQVLSDTLDGKIQIDLLLKWLVNETLEDATFKELRNNKCLQSDFVSYFLNFIHDIQAFANKSVEIPQKVSTPKRIEHFINTRDENNSETPSIKRRSALFENGTPQSQTDLPNFIHSTPKVIKNNIDESYASPLSPLYNRQNFMTPRNRYSNSTPRTTPTLCLGDFIITTNKLSSKKKAQRSLNENLFSCAEENSGTTIKTRRINPTSVAQRKYNNMNFRKNDNSFTFENGADEIIDHSNGQRSFLVEERMKIISRKSATDNSSTLAVSKPFLTSRKKEVVPSFKLITFKQQLDILVLIYNFMLDHNFILNLASELYFLISLLLGRDYEENDDVSPNNSSYLGVSPLLDDINFNCDNKNDTKFSNNTLFGTIHNRVYFASKVLQSQISILSVLDRSTLRLLIENKRLKNFTSSSFMSHLLHIHEDKPEKTSEILEHIQSNVCFISDTDNRDNFPNDPSFHAFRKQRDLFYEIIRIWENNHLQDEWNFVVALGGKIKALLNMHPDAINLVHLARLFKAQLLMNTCGKHEDTENAVSESQLSFLTSIPNVDTEKLLRLKSRIVSKQSENSINSTPVFSGYQEFYRDFILVAANHIFNRHLNDALISEIIDLNNTKFSWDFDDNDGSVDLSTQNAYTLCIKSLRILAKLLGFLESLPYKSENTQLSQNVISCQIRIRNEIQPGLNLKTIISNSITNKSLILTIPWIIKYLSMLDHITLRLSYFEEILDMLFEIYYFHLNNKLTSTSKHNYKQKNLFLVKLCLGWLFELPHFPEDSYYKFLSQKLPSSKLTMVQNNNSSEIIFLDELDLVDQNVLYICCPYLQDIKKILSDSINTLNNSNVTIKHITPLTAVESPTDLSNKRIQLQLEEAFFNGQPVSIRKTIEFISERVASSCVKQICNEIVPPYKKKVLTDLKDLLSLFNVPDNISSDNEEFAKIKTMITMESSKFANSSLNAIREHIDEELKPFSSTRIASAVDSLLALDVLTQTKDVCVSIATRLCRERVQQWINSHVNLGIFSKDFDAEVRHFMASQSSKLSKHKPVFALPIYGKDLKHNPDALSGVELVEHIRSNCWTVLEKPNNLTVDMIMELLKLVQQSTNERCDLNDCIFILINRMLVDFLILVIGNRGDIILDSEDIVMDFCSIWKQNNCHINDLFKTLVCFRNIQVISHSSTASISWKSFEKFLKTLLEEKLLTYDLLEAQVVAVDKDRLDEVTLKDLYACIKAVMNVYLKTGETSNGSSSTSNTFTLLMNFLKE